MHNIHLTPEETTSIGEKIFLASQKVHDEYIFSIYPDNQKIIQWKTSKKLFGYEVSELTYEKLIEICDKNFRKMFIFFMESDMDFYQINTKFKSKNLDDHYVCVYFYLSRTETGDKFYKTFCINDITNDIQFNYRLLSEATKFKNIFNKSSFGQILFNKNKEINLINEYAANMIKKEDDKGNSLQTLLYKYLEKIDFNDVEDNVEINVEIILEEKTYFKAILSSVKDGEYRDFVLCQIYNNTTHQVIENRKNEIEEDIKQFAYVASHDLREPLRQIYNFSEMLEDSVYEKFSENEKKYFNYIKSGSLKAISLANDLLLFSRSSNLDLLEKNIIEPKKIIKEIIMTLNIPEKTIKILEMPKLYINKTQIYQVFYNLISNSYKFSSKNQVPKITIGFNESNNFYIKDNGIGIPKNMLEKLFKPFVRIHNPDEYEGNGLGLSICKRTINRLGGDIWVENNKKKGCIFFFNIGKSFFYIEEKEAQ